MLALLWNVSHCNEQHYSQKINIPDSVLHDALNTPHIERAFLHIQTFYHYSASMLNQKVKKAFTKGTCTGKCLTLIKIIRQHPTNPIRVNFQLMANRTHDIAKFQLFEIMECYLDRIDYLRTCQIEKNRNAIPTTTQEVKMIHQEAKDGIIGLKAVQGRAILTALRKRLPSYLSQEVIYDHSNLHEIINNGRLCLVRLYTPKHLSAHAVIYQASAEMGYWFYNSATKKLRLYANQNTLFCGFLDQIKFVHFQYTLAGSYFIIEKY